MTDVSDPGADRYRRRKRREEEHQTQLPGEDGESLPPPTDPIRATLQPKRNEPCPCGSGKKHKNCCGTHAS